MNAATLLAIFGAVVAILAIGAAVVIGLRGQALTVDLERLRKSNTDLRSEVDDKDRRVHDLEVEQGHLKEANQRMSAALSRIGEQAASGTELQHLATAIRDAVREMAAARKTFERRDLA